MKTVYTVKKLGADRISYNLSASRFVLTRWAVDASGKASKSGAFHAHPVYVDGEFGYRARIDGYDIFFPSDKDATAKGHAVKPA